VNIVSLAEARDARDPHSSGRAICCACGHEWIAVVKNAPQGERITFFDCPKCGTIRGQFKDQFGVPKDTLVFECGDCGSTLFRVYKHPADGTVCLLCAGCGSDRNAMDLFS
jgi:hypothetical protein